MTRNIWLLGQTVAFALVALYTTGVLGGASVAAQDESLIYPVYVEPKPVDPIDQGDIPSDWGNGEESIEDDDGEKKPSDDGGGIPDDDVVFGISCEEEMEVLRNTFQGDALELSSTLSLPYEHVVTAQFLITNDPMPCEGRRDAVYVIVKTNFLVNHPNGNDDVAEAPLGSYDLSASSGHTSKKMKNTKLIKTCKTIAKKRRWIK